MRRREFIVGGAAVAVAGRAWGQTGSDESKLARMSVMTYCFDRIVKGRGKPGDPERTLDILDAPQMIADRYGIHHVEFQHSHFEATDKAYFKQVRDRLKKANSQMTQICLEFDPLDISARENYMRLETIDLTKQWIDYAVELDCPRVLVNQGTLAPDVVQSATATLKAIGDYAKTKKIFVNLENRGGGRPPATPAAIGTGASAAGGTPAPSTPAPSNASPNTNVRGGWEVLVQVIKAAGVYANPDIGNFPDEESRAAGLRVMYQLTSGNSHAHYSPDLYNEENALHIAKEVGYKGLYSIETTTRNNGPDPYAAVQSVRDALLKII
jgi:hypothetical protein